MRARLVLCGALLFYALIALDGAEVREGSRGPYLVPQTVYVGDRATLVVPLSETGGSASARRDGVSGPGGTTVLEGAALLALNAVPADSESLPVLELHRIELERRPRGTRLLVDFSAYAPGIFELPPFEIGGNRFAGLRVEVSSILDSGGAVLSGPEPPLSVPGTSLFLYGTMTLLVLLPVLSLWAAFRGRSFFGGWMEKLKRRRLIVSMAGIEKRMRRNIRKGKAGDYGKILNVLSSEFRAFLSFFTGEDCRAMTSAELGSLPPLATVVAANTGDGAGAGDAGAGADAEDDAAFSVLSGGYLSGFFYRCDELRFSGREIAGEELFAILGDLKRFLETLDRAERGKFRELRI
ncbi:MAG: hypothetical protein LBS57_01920 [Treponema sp.]|nr:hypothetical protein [Treponema sp.]